MSLVLPIPGYAIDQLRDEDPGSVAASFLSSMVENIAVVAGIVAVVALAHTAGAPAAAVADAVLLTGGVLLAGYTAAKFLYDTVLLGMELEGTRLCDESALKGIGSRLASSIGELGEALAESVLLGAVGRIGRVLDDVGEYAGDGLWAIWRKLRSRFRDEPSEAGRCSFDGETLVSTRDGHRSIRDIEAGRDEVWARDEVTGRSGWRTVLAQYGNRYESTVEVTARDGDGRRQTIVSNRIHPYFTRIAATTLIATGGVTAAIASEGHVYAGDIDGGAWVDAQHLRVGDGLLGERGRWQTIERVAIEEKPLEAYNLTVEGYSTYFVAGEVGAEAVWVHNTCRNTRYQNLSVQGLDAVPPGLANPAAIRSDLYDNHIKFGKRDRGYSIATASVRTDDGVKHYIAVSGSAWKGDATHYTHNGVEYEIIRTDSGSVEAFPAGPHDNRNRPVRTAL